MEQGIEDIYGKLVGGGYEVELLDFPHRPKWSYQFTKEELEQREEDSYRDWLGKIQDRFPIEQLSFFELNLEVWRQLWRTVEISDVLLIVTDIRQPVFHFPPALYDFVVKKHHKPLLVVLNKIDLVAHDVVDAWVEYFHKLFPGIHTIPFSNYPMDRSATEGSCRCMLGDSATKDCASR